MNKYIVTGNSSDECRDVCHIIYGMYWAFLESRGAIVKPFSPYKERMEGFRGGGAAPDRNELGFETDFDLDIACGYHRVCRISPFDLQGKRYTTFTLLSKWENVPIEYPIKHSILTLVLNPHVKMTWHFNGHEKSLDILGDDVTKVLRQGTIPWPTNENENH